MTGHQVCQRALVNNVEINVGTPKSLPSSEILTNLYLEQPKTEILGAPDLYIDRGSTINLTCIILQSPEPPAYIFWNHNNAYNEVKNLNVVQSNYTTVFLFENSNSFVDKERLMKG
uniref:Ig-like domain-containing protein n=1 Tax=Vespula pensylvanica TaxID=30213 RepID=A0A834P9Q7_VESPE|nr:hypothetical protein H0235_002376 [Vespula pensylvanica]